MLEDLEFLKHPDIRKFIKKYKDADPHQLLLNPPNEIRGRQKLVVDQMISHRKSKNKLPTWYANPDIIYPPPVSIEQCSSEATAKTKSSRFSGGHLIDLTGGTGVDTIGFSRSFSRLTYVEPNPWLCHLFDHNRRVLGIDIEVVNSSAEAYLSTMEPGNATFYLDPDRRPGKDTRVLNLSSSEPKIGNILTELLQKGSGTIVKASPMMDITLGISELQRVESIYILSIKNEVKEILFYLTESGSADPLISCDELTGSDPITFTFRKSEEKSIEVEYAPLSKYLLDPFSCILKAGAFKSVQNRFPLKKLGVNTHLYTSDLFVDDFPGRTFMVESVNPSKREIRAHKTMNVITRDFSLNSTDLKKKYGLQDGGELFLIGYRDLKSTPQLVICRKMTPDEPRKP